MAIKLVVLFLALPINDITPKESLRFQYCHEQGFDASCGLTVVTSALSHYWGIEVSEIELIEKVLGEKLDDGDYTVNLADIALAFELYGISTKAYRLDWEGLMDVVAKGYSPVIVHYEKPDKHFAMLLAARDKKADKEKIIEAIAWGSSKQVVLEKQSERLRYRW